MNDNAEAYTPHTPSSINIDTPTFQTGDLALTIETPTLPTISAFNSAPEEPTIDERNFENGYFKYFNLVNFYAIFFNILKKDSQSLGHLEMDCKLITKDTHTRSGRRLMGRSRSAARKETAAAEQPPQIPYLQDLRQFSPIIISPAMMTF